MACIFNCHFMHLLLAKYNEGDLLVMPPKLEHQMKVGNRTSTYHFEKQIWITVIRKTSGKVTRRIGHGRDK